MVKKICFEIVETINKFESRRRRFRRKGVWQPRWRDDVEWGWRQLVWRCSVRLAVEPMQWEVVGNADTTLGPSLGTVEIGFSLSRFMCIGFHFFYSWIRLLMSYVFGLLWICWVSEVLHMYLYFFFFLYFCERPFILIVIDFLFPIY